MKFKFETKLNMLQKTSRIYGPPCIADIVYTITKFQEIEFFFYMFFFVICNIYMKQIPDKIQKSP